VSLKTDLEDCLIYDFLERGTTWEELKETLSSIISGTDPREDSDRVKQHAI
jgi:hypothetical protein